MSKVQEEITAALDAYELRMQNIGGCSDGACVVIRPKGMHTNGGCKCWKNPHNMQRLARAANNLTNSLRKALENFE